MSRLFLLAHKRTVGSGAQLAKAIGAKCIVPNFPPKGGFREGDTVINWGVSSPPKFSSSLQDHKVKIVNSFFGVRNAVNKCRTLDILQSLGIASLRPIRDTSTAINTLYKGNTGAKLFARSTVCGSKGEGIDIFDQSNCSALLSKTPSPYKLFTMGFNKTHEFRVHVVDGKVVDYAQKKKMGKVKLAQNGINHIDLDIRSHLRGWVFTKVNVLHFPEVEQLAIDAVKALGLNFGAVDILATVKAKQLKQCVVCEVNTSPALSAESTMRAYVTALVQ